MTKVAFLGTGLLGSAFAEAAAKRGGDEITVWNRTIEKAKALEQFGIRVASTPADAVRGAQIIHLILKDDAVVEQVIGDLRPGLDKQAIICDHTTTQPRLTAERSKRLNGEGVRYLHCPVFIGPVAARQAKGTILASGPRALFDEVKPSLEKMAERVEYFGERPDVAALIKLSGNAFIIGFASLVADVIAMARSENVPPEDVLKVAEIINAGPLVPGARGRAMLAQKFDATFELEMARKDVRLMIETAGDRPLAVLPGVAARMDQLIASGNGKQDLSVVGKA